jgi:hypothetical protein
VPALAYLQFSYRLLGILVPCLAWLAGAATDALIRRAPAVQPALILGLAGLCLLAAIPLLNPLPWPDFGPVTPKVMLDDELYGLWGVGTTWQSEFLPATVRTPPGVHPTVQAAIYAGTYEKVDRAALPAGAQVAHTRHTALRDDFDITAGTGFTLPVFTFYWPGWASYLDGQPAPVEVSDPDGFIRVAIPPGTHALSLRLEDTPARRLGWTVSALALVTLAGVLVIWHPPRFALLQPGTAPLPARLALALAGLAAGAFAVRVGWDAGLRWQAAHSIPIVAEAQTPRYAPFDNGMALVAYSFEQTQAHPGDPVTLTFYWKVMRPMPRPASVFVHFYGLDGTLWGQADKPDPVEFYPTTRWVLGRVTRDDELAILRPDAPPGVYTVAVGLWDRTTGRRSLLLDAAGQVTEHETLTLSTTFGVVP